MRSIILLMSVVIGEPPFAGVRAAVTGPALGLLVGAHRVGISPATGRLCTERNTS